MSSFYWICKYTSWLYSSHSFSTGYLQSSKVFYHPLTEKSLKAFNILASQHCSHEEFFFLATQSTNFFPNETLWHNYQKISQLASLAQVFSSAKFMRLSLPKLNLSILINQLISKINLPHQTNQRNLWNMPN